MSPCTHSDLVKLALLVNVLCASPTPAYIVPLALIEPDTCNVFVGLVVPIPILPVPSFKIRFCPPPSPLLRIELSLESTYILKLLPLSELTIPIPFSSLSAGWFTCNVPYAFTALPTWSPTVKSPLELIPPSTVKVCDGAEFPIPTLPSPPLNVTQLPPAWVWILISSCFKTKSSDAEMNKWTYLKWNI